MILLYFVLLQIYHYHLCNSPQINYAAKRFCVFLNGSQHSKFEFAFAFPANLQNSNFHFPPNIQNSNSNFQFPCFRTFKIRGECSESLSPSNFSSMRFRIFNFPASEHSKFEVNVLNRYHQLTSAP